MKKIDKFQELPLHAKLASLFVVGLGMSLLTTVALTNIMVLLILLTAPWAWSEYLKQDHPFEEAKIFLGFILLFCTWDVITNIIAGHSLFDALKALLHDVRTFGFIFLLWPVFANAFVSRVAIWSVLTAVILLALANLILTMVGYIPQGSYFWPTGPHLYGQILVGLFFLMAQVAVVRPDLARKLAFPMLILLLSLLFASNRRTGYLQLAVGFFVWGLLNQQKLLIGKYRWLMPLALVVAVFVAFTSDVVSARMAQIVDEFQLFLSQSNTDRVTKLTSVGIRLQFYVSTWELITNSNWWIGVGSISFPDLFFSINEKFGASDRTVFTNPHNEYLYVLATKGIIGLILYVAIFFQACVMSWKNSDQVQRIASLMFVFVFLFSITTNSMMIDMEEGHFMMLILLAFLAPKALNFPKAKSL
jgi:O-antigen ligase